MSWTLLENAVTVDTSTLFLSLCEAVLGDEGLKPGTGIKVELQGEFLCPDGSPNWPVSERAFRSAKKLLSPGYAMVARRHLAAGGLTAILSRSVDGAAPNPMSL